MDFNLHINQNVPIGVESWQYEYVCQDAAHYPPPLDAKTNKIRSKVVSIDPQIQWSPNKSIILFLMPTDGLQHLYVPKRTNRCICIMNVQMKL